MDNNDYFALSRELEMFHTIFYKMWEIGEPVFDELVPTACVTFDKKGKHLSYHFNPEFWESLNNYQRCFVIAHECVHILSNHGKRFSQPKYRLNKEIANYAMDVAVNEGLTRRVGFIRSDLGDLFEEMVSCEKLWPDEDVPTDESAEWYYEKIVQNAKEVPACFQFDVHGDFTLEDLRDMFDDLSPEEAKEMNEFLDDLEDKSSKEAGTEKGNQVFTAKAKYNPKRKWESVIKKWSMKYKPELTSVEQWTQRNRRLNTLPSDLFIPSDYDDDMRSEDMIEVYFFQDTSGSCAGFRDRFFAAANTLPRDKFKIRMFCFDTQVYETSLDSGKLYGFGGTSFDILEAHIQATMKREGIKYPEAIFVITDGYGNQIKPEFPKKWYWFLSENHTYCIPKECNIHMLENYE